jgi:hypothetical protein
MRKTTVILMALVGFFVCGSSPVQEALCQTDPLWNHSKTAYVTFFTRTIHGSADKIWIPVVKDLVGTTLYEDLSSGSSSYQDNWWAWDSQNRLWFYNTTTHKAWVYFQDKDIWRKMFYLEKCGIDAPDFVLRRIEEDKTKNPRL